MTTGQRIRNARKKAGMTQTELAQKLNIPFQSISQWERDLRNPKFDTIQRIAEVLRASPAYLMGWENDFGEQDLWLPVLDVAKWLNTTPEIVELVMEDMGWPNVTTPEILSKISAEVERRKIMEKHPITWTRSLREKLQNVGCLLESTELILGATDEPNTKWILFPDGKLELSDQELQELDYSTDSFLRFKLQELREKYKETFKPHKPQKDE